MTYILSDPVPAAYPFLFSAAQPGEAAGEQRGRGWGEGRGGGGWRGGLP